MNQFQKDKLKAINQERVLLNYRYKKAMHLYFIMHRIKSSRRMMKTCDQIVKLTFQVRMHMMNIEVIRQQPIPKFRPGGIGCGDVGFTGFTQCGPETITGRNYSIGIDPAKPGYDKSMVGVFSNGSVIELKGFNSSSHVIHVSKNNQALIDLLKRT